MVLLRATDRLSLRRGLHAPINFLALKFMYPLFAPAINNNISLNQIVFVVFINHSRTYAEGRSQRYTNRKSTVDTMDWPTCFIFPFVFHEHQLYWETITEHGLMGKLMKCQLLWSMSCLEIDSWIDKPNVCRIDEADYSPRKNIRTNVCLYILSYMHDIAIPTKDLYSRY